MKIENKLLDNIASLAAISLNEKEKEHLLDYLKKTLSYFEKIKTIDTKNVPPLISPLNSTLRLREDKVIDFAEKQALLDQAPEKQGNLFKVPPVV